MSTISSIQFSASSHPLWNCLRRKKSGACVNALLLPVIGSLSITARTGAAAGATCKSAAAGSNLGATTNGSATLAKQRLKPDSPVDTELESDSEQRDFELCVPVSTFSSMTRSCRSGDPQRSQHVKIGCSGWVVPDNRSRNRCQTSVTTDRETGN